MEVGSGWERRIIMERCLAGLERDFLRGGKRRQGGVGSEASPLRRISGGFLFLQEAKMEIMTLSYRKRGSM